MRRQTKREHGLRRIDTLHPGVLIVVQRFRADLGLYVHLHALVSDGCFEAAGDEDVHFLPARQWSSSSLMRVLDRLHQDLAEHLDEEDAEPPDGAVATCVQVGLRSPPLRAVLENPPPAVPMLVAAHGMQLHAAVTVDGRDHQRLERLCRYLLRLAFAHDAVERMPDGQVRVHFKAPQRSGATFAQMSPDTFLARLCGLVPAPAVHLVRYYGALASRHALRSRIVPQTHTHPPPPKQLSLFLTQGQHDVAAVPGPMLDSQRIDRSLSRLSWMTHLARVFRIHVSICVRCSGPVRIVRAVTDPDAIANELHGARAPPRPPPPGQLLLVLR